MTYDPYFWGYKNLDFSMGFGVQWVPSEIVTKKSPYLHAWDIVSASRFSTKLSRHTGCGK